MGFQVSKSPTPQLPARLRTWGLGTQRATGFQLCNFASPTCAFVELKLQGPLNSKSPTPQLPARLRTWGLGTQRATGFQLCNFASPTPCALGDLELKGPLNFKCATPQLPNSPAHLGSWGVGTQWGFCLLPSEYFTKSISPAYLRPRSIYCSIT